jgi:RND family efflux transporter MFP subunit
MPGSSPTEAGGLTTVSDLRGDLASLRIDREKPRTSPWRWPLLLLVPALLFLGSLYFLQVRSAMGAPEVETARPSVTQAGSAAAGTPILTASGYVVARRKAVVSAKIQGRLAELWAEEGTRVRQGQLVARLESAEYQAALARARAQVARMEADLEESRRLLRQAQSLSEQQIMARDQLEAAENRVKVGLAALAQARADVDFAAAQLANTRIEAPFAGTVVKKMAEVGESVAPIPPGVNISTSSGAVVALADLDTLEVEADVSESNVARLGPDQPAEVTVEAFPDRRYRAVLRQVIPTADRTKATVQVKVTILEKDPALKPEMSSKVTFLEKEQTAAASATPAAPVVSVPAAVLVQREGRPVVFELQEGKVRARPVVPGPERQGQVEVRSGLGGYETLVVRPPDSLKDGDAVRVKKG